MTERLVVIVVGVALLGCSGPPGPEATPETAAESAETAPAALPTSESTSPETEEADPSKVRMVQRVQIPQKQTPPPIDPAELEVVHGYTEQFYGGDLEALFERFSPEMQQTMPLETLNLFRDQVEEIYGTETEVIAEESQNKDDYRGFMRWARFDKTDEIIEVLWILREDDSIAGLFVRPAKRPQPDAGP